MKEKNAIFVPTRWVYEYIIGSSINNNSDSNSINNDESNENDSKDRTNTKTKQKVAIDESIIKARKAYTTHENAMKCAIKHNVTIACGTDMFVDEWSRMGEELTYYVKYGMSNLDAIKCATANGPLTLGPVMAPKSGQLKVGYDADIIALSKNPLNDIRVLSGPKNVIIVCKNGKIEKNTCNSMLRHKL